MLQAAASTPSSTPKSSKSDSEWSGLGRSPKHARQVNFTELFHGIIASFCAMWPWYRLQHSVLLPCHSATEFSDHMPNGFAPVNCPCTVLYKTCLMMSNMQNALKSYSATHSTGHEELSASFNAYMHLQVASTTSPSASSASCKDGSPQSGASRGASPPSEHVRLYSGTSFQLCNMS